MSRLLILGHHWALSIITHKAWLGPDGGNCPLCNVHNNSRAISDRRLSDFGECREAARDTDSGRSQEAGAEWPTEERSPGYCEHYLATRGRRITSSHRGVDRFVTQKDITDHRELTRTD